MVTIDAQSVSFLIADATPGISRPEIRGMNAPEPLWFEFKLVVLLLHSVASSF